MSELRAPKVLDNKNNFVYEEIKDSVKKGSKLSVISALFSMYAYDAIKKDLDKIDSMRFIYTKPSFLREKNKEAREYYIDNNNIFGNDYEIKLKNEMTQGSVSRDFSRWISEKLEIKSFKIPNEAQLRMICVDNGDNSNIAINGSVDFTTTGLGINKSDRQDFNQCVYGKDISNSFLMMFEALWNDEELLEDVKEEVLEQMKTMHKENPAEYIYFLSLYNIFSGNLDALDEDKIIRKGNSLKESAIWNKLYKFQKDAVMGVIDKIENYNGCILADSVGLGKTFTALAVIKYYESRNDRVLVLVPKKLRDNWTIYTQNDKRNIFVDDRFNYDVLNHTDLSRETGYSGDLNLETINWGNYDLVVIDESHNFRNNPAVKDRVTRYQKLMDEIIKGGHKTRLLMLSATPVNNKMTDIKNQIAFITEDNDKALADYGINSIDYTLRRAQTAFNSWSKFSKEKKANQNFIDTIDLDYFKLLDTLTIARSRRHIEKYYDLNDIGNFPERLTPINQHPDIDMENEFSNLEEINSRISILKLGIYSPLYYVYPNKMESYEEKYDVSVKSGQSIFKQIDRDRNVVGLMRVNILKRLESSIDAFRLTIKRLVDITNTTISKIDKGIDYIDDLDINLIDPEQEEYDDLMFGKNRKVLLQDMDLVKWKDDLEFDKHELEALLNKANKITPERDAKLNALKNLISNKQHNPINPNNKKLIIFTAFADTAKYLYKNIHQWALDEFGLHSALVTGGDDNKTTLKAVKNKNNINDVLINFSPKSKEREFVDKTATEEIDILICTDCISEGQNLQDCDYLVNYDIHWNPVRIIQRFGRIDRIGSDNKYIQLVNFWPNMDLDEYINLEGRVKNRMVMVDIAATGEENIISKDQTMNDLEYRRKQLEELQDRVLDLEDIDNTISITDLTFNDFKIELMDYMKEHRNELEKAPKGIYSIVNIPDDLDNIEPGVIFLLRQLTGTTETKERNPLSPYYLVYIGEDNTVKYNYMNSKKVLDFYQKLCLGKDKVLHDLVKDFNMETNNGKDMEKYSSLLVETIENILGKKQEAGVKSLFSKGGTATVKQDINGLEEFELITFLIVK